MSYLGDQESNDMISAITGHAETNGIWTQIVAAYMPINMKFRVAVEQFMGDSLEKADVVLVYGPNKDVVLVIEGKPAKTESWDMVRTQSYRYICDLKKKNHPTIGVMAQGPEFIMFEVPGQSMGGNSTKWIPVGINEHGGKVAPGKPSHLVHHALALEETPKAIAQRAVNGEFRND